MTARITDLTQARLSRRYAEMVADGVPSIPTAHLNLVDKTPRSVVERQIEFAEEYQRDYGDMPTGVALVERIGEALGSDNAFRCYVSFIAGSFFTLAMAYIWSVVL